MALPAKLEDMMSSARQRANMPDSNFITDAELTSLLNYRLNRLYNKLIDARGQNYFRKTGYFPTSTNADTYQLGTVGMPDFFQLISVDVVLSGYGTTNAVKVPMRRFNEDERDDYVAYPAFTPATGAPLRYQLLGAQDMAATTDAIKLIPVPAGTYYIGVNYVPAFRALVNPTDAFNGVSGFEDWAVWMTAADMLAKEESDASYPIAQAAELDRDIANLKKARDANEPPRILDVRRDIFARWGVR